MSLRNLNADKLTLLHSLRGFAAVFVAICHAKWIFWSGGTEYVKFCQGFLLHIVTIKMIGLWENSISIEH